MRGWSSPEAENKNDGDCGEHGSEGGPEEELALRAVERSECHHYVGWENKRSVCGVVVLLIGRGGKWCLQGLVIGVVVGQIDEEKNSRGNGEKERARVGKEAEEIVDEAGGYAKPAAPEPEQGDAE